MGTRHAGVIITAVGSNAGTTHLLLSKYHVGSLHGSYNGPCGNGVRLIKLPIVDCLSATRVFVIRAAAWLSGGFRFRHKAAL